MSRVEMRDPYKTYNKLSLSELNQKHPVSNGKVFWQHLK